MATLSALESFAATYITSHKSNACDVYDKENPWKYVQDVFEKEINISQKSKKTKGKAVASIFAACLAMNAKIETLKNELQSSKNIINKKEKEIDKLEIQVQSLTSLNCEINKSKQESDKNCLNAEKELEICKEKLFETEKEKDQICNAYSVVQNELENIKLGNSAENSKCFNVLQQSTSVICAKNNDDSSTFTFACLTDNNDTVRSGGECISSSQFSYDLPLATSKANSKLTGDCSIIMDTVYSGNGEFKNINKSPAVVISVCPPTGGQNTQLENISVRHLTACLTNFQTFDTQSPKTLMVVGNSVESINILSANMSKSATVLIAKFPTNNSANFKNANNPPEKGLEMSNPLELNALKNDLQSNKWVNIMDTVNGFTLMLCKHYPHCECIFLHSLDTQKYTWCLDVSHGHPELNAEYKIILTKLSALESMFQAPHEKHSGNGMKQQQRHCKRSSMDIKEIGSMPSTTVSLKGMTDNKSRAMTDIRYQRHNCI